MYIEVENEQIGRYMAYIHIDAWRTAGPRCPHGTARRGTLAPRCIRSACPAGSNVAARPPITVPWYQHRQPCDSSHSSMHRCSRPSTPPTRQLHPCTGAPDRIHRFSPRATVQSTEHRVNPSEDAATRVIHRFYPCTGVPDRVHRTIAVHVVPTIVLRCVRPCTRRPSVHHVRREDPHRGDR